MYVVVISRFFFAEANYVELFVTPRFIQRDFEFFGKKDMVSSQDCWHEDSLIFPTSTLFDLSTTMRILIASSFFVASCIFGMVLIMAEADATTETVSRQVRAESLSDVCSVFSYKFQNLDTFERPHETWP